MTNKKVETLVKDIYSFLNGETLNDYIKQNPIKLGEIIDEVYTSRFRQERDDNGGGLRLSSLGTPCRKKLWYKKYHHSLGESLDPPTLFKFFYGDILEAVLLQLARDSGHLVTGEQDELTLHGIKGHRDCVIDGVTIDCKSSSSFSFGKFKHGLTRANDTFGYLTQLGSYVEAAENDPLVLDKQRGGFLVVDKQFGHICLDLHTFDFTGSKEFVDSVKSVVNNENEPERDIEDQSEGKSGNRSLKPQCSYCEFKKVCWPGLQKYMYSGKPKFLTVVKKEPNVKKAF